MLIYCCLIMSTFVVVVVVVYGGECYESISDPAVQYCTVP